MNLKLTKKEVLNDICGTHRSAQFATLQHTIEVLEDRGNAQKIGYNKGRVSWNFDCYVLTDEEGGRPIVLTTGYGNLVGDMVKYDICRYLEHNAHNMATNDIIKAIIDNQ